MEMSKAEQVIGRFTKDPALTKKILGHIKGVRAGTKTIDQVIGEHTTDPKIKAKVHEAIGKVKAGHSIHSIAAYHAPDPDTAYKAAAAAHEHVGAIKNIIKGK
jgi:hypothetical protein